MSLTYLGNMGVLLEAGDRRILIDGLHRGGLATYAAVPPQLLIPLETAQPPYRSLSAAVTTHRHLDHFDRQSVAARLAADTVMVYGAPQEVVDTLRGAGPMPGLRRVIAVKTGVRGRTAIGAGIVGLDLPHNPTRNRATNAGYLVEIGGLRVLHVGDADPQVGNYAPYQLAAARIDVAIVPFWYLTEDTAELRRAIGARRWVASHVPLADTAKVRREVRNVIPDALVLARPGERILLR